MVNSETTLQEFIQYIPLLNKNCHLQRVVSAIYSSSQRMIALVNDDGTPQGIVYGYLLLKSIKEKAFKDENGYFELTKISCKEISIPLITLSSKTKVRDFFDNFCFDNQDKKQDYWIVDKDKKLLGILNIPKLLQVLCFEQAWRENELQDSLIKTVYPIREASKTYKEVDTYYCNKKTALTTQNIQSKNRIISYKPAKSIFDNKKKQSFKKTNFDFVSFFNKVDFPLAIENEKGDVCYQNSYWIDTVFKKENSYSTTKWQLELTQKSSNSRSKLKNKAFKENAIDIEKPICNNCFAANTYNDNFKNKLKQQIKLYSSASERINKVDFLKNKLLGKNVSWYYYRVPLRMNEDKIEISNRPEYWLRFATKFPLFKDTLSENKYQADNQAELKQIRDELILNISHDIKSPLTAIIGLSSLLKEEKIGNIDNQIRYSRIIYQSGKKLISLINDFLHIIRLTTENFELNLEFIDIENLCNKVYARVKQKLEAVTTKNQNNTLFPQLELDINLEGNLAIADKECLAQIIDCFLENALELVESQQTISIKAEYWANWLAITVSNRGKGLSENQQNFSIAKLSQNNNFLTSQEKNQEIRLILAQQLAQTHGGDISLISQNNYGSQFTVLLPDSDLNYGSNTTINSDRESRVNSLILIVATSSTVIIDLSEKLKALGYQCAIARNKTDALYKASRLKPYKIIVNSSMVKPNEDIVTTLKENSVTQNIPIIVVNNVSSETKLQTDTGVIFSNQNYLKTINNCVEQFIDFPCQKTTLTQFFSPLVSNYSSTVEQNLTVLRLSLTEENTRLTNNSSLDFIFNNPSFSLAHHIIEADSIEQADLLARIWHIDVVIWDGINLIDTQNFIQSFAESDTLANIPLITLDIQNTEIANTKTNLTVFPCLLPPKECSIQKLSQVIQIATGCFKKLR